MEAQTDELKEESKAYYRDCAKRLIQEGQIVAATQDGYTYALHLAQVIGFTPKKVKIRFKDGTETTKFGIQLAII